MPPQQSQSWIKWFYQRSQSNPVIPPHFKNQERCLDFFLEEYKEILCSQTLMNNLFHKLVDDILHLFGQLERQKICQGDHYGGEERFVQNFKEVSLECELQYGRCQTICQFFHHKFNFDCSCSSKTSI